MEQKSSPLICPAHTNQYLAMLMLGILLGASASFIYFRQELSKGETAYQSGFEAAKKLVVESPLGGMFRIPDDVRVLSGTVTAINGNRVTFHLQTSSPFEDQTLNNRTILVASSTTLSKLMQKDQKEIQAEMEKLIKASPSKTSGTSTSPVMPSAFTTATASIKDIVVGDSITVITSANVKTLKEFPAQEIKILPKINMFK